MLTNKITISDDLLDTVRGILGEAKKCPADCECEKCEAEEMEEGYASAAQRKAVWANRADDGAGHPDKKKKLKEEILEMVNEASSGLADKAKKSGVSLSTLKKVYARGIAAWNSGHRPGTTPQQWAHARVNSYITKGKGTYHGADKDLRSEGADMPFEGPYKKAGEERKDQYGNKVKNVAKYLAKKAMKANEEAEHNNCGTPECCGQCDTTGQIDETAKIVAHLQKRYGDNIRKSHVRSAANDFGVDASKLAKAVRTKLGKNMLDEEQIDELSDTYSAPARVPQKMIKPEAARRMANTANRKNMSDKDMETVLFNQGHGRKSLKLINQLRKEEHEEDDGWYTHSQMHGSKKSEKHPKGISAAEWKSGIRWHHGKNKRINIKEEAEQIDELSKNAMLKYLSANKKSDKAAQEKGDYSKSDKRMRGTDVAVRKYTASPNSKYVRVPATEEAEQIDEISKATMGRYINKAADRMSTQGVTAGLKIAADEKSKKNFDTIAKRQKGIATAVSKLTKEEQDFVDSLNDETFEEVELDEAHDGYKTNSEKSKFNSGHRAKLMNPEGKPAYLSQKSYNTPAHAKAAAKFYGSIMHLPIRTIDSKMSDYNKAYDAKHGDVKESVELDEARGRPRKAGAKDFTIHPKTKEKLMHNNPADMKTIEVLQKNGILEKPKIEAGQHIMNQLSKAKTSMLGGSKIHFTHGDSKEVSGTHAAKILTKYAGMRPNEKEDFQKFVGHSHENLMKHV